MTIKVTYNVTDVYMSQSVSPVYINVSYSDGGQGIAVWGGITGTLSNQTDLQNALNAKFDDPTGTTAQYIRGDGSLATFPALTGYVPYTGATTNVNLGEYELKAGQVTLDTSPTGTAAVGTTRWNDTTGVSETTLKGGNVIIKNGVDLVARVVNKVTPNTTLTKAAYQAVRVSGAQGQRLAVAFAQANNDANSADTIGIVIETISTNQEGFIMTVGQLEGINTTGSLQGETWADGDVLYLSPTTAGAITNIKPTAVTGHIVVVGYVEYAHVNNGKIYIKIMNGWELDELHNVSIVTPTNNQGLFYNSSNSLWENKSIATVLGYTPEQPLTFNSPLSRAGNVVSMPQSTGSVNGFLSATDWTTFNSKQAALGYTPANAATTLTINGVTFDLSQNRSWTIAAGISGSGAAGQVTYWTGASAVSGSSLFTWDNTNRTLLLSGAQIYQNINQTNTTLDSAVSFLENNVIKGGIQYLGSAFSVVNRRELIEIVGRAGISFRTTVEFARFSNVGNLLLNSTTDNGQRLQVYGDTLLRGSGNTSATTALTVQNSSSTDMFRVRNDGFTFTNFGSYIGSSNNNVILSTDASGTSSASGLNLRLLFGAFTTAGYGLSVLGFNSQTRTATSGESGVLLLAHGFAPTSGTGTFTGLAYNGTINQTGGANGITRGLYVNPTLTAAADWRSIEWSNNSGWGLYGAGTANNYLGGNVAIGSTSNTTDWLNIAASTTAKAHIYLAAGVAPTSPSNGDIWFDGTDIKMRIGGVTKTFTLI